MFQAVAKHIYNCIGDPKFLESQYHIDSVNGWLEFQERQPTCR